MLFDLKSRIEEIIGNANGSTFLEISKGKFRQMKIKLPDLEKNKIAYDECYFFVRLMLRNVTIQELINF